MDTYKTIEFNSKGLFKDRGSKFLSFSYRVRDEKEIKEILHNLKKEYYDARHHCYAYRLGIDKKKFRINDDGEPSNTAGNPIMGQIKSKDLTNILIVVVRYFGGKLLGVRGLINAYRNASLDAIENTKIIVEIVKTEFKISFDYLYMNKIMKIMKDENLKPKDQKFNLKYSFFIKIRKRDEKRIIEKLKKFCEISYL
ncbi:MAG: YigZ family protein [Bacteroidetes bacterium 4572_128]|nr:MAG: YigZ family protein [Bacteroidetes bacterium 4572_128]